MLDLSPGTGRRMKTWEKIAWPIWATAYVGMLGWFLYAIFTH